MQPLLGRRKLKDLTPVVLDNAFREIQESGGGRTFSKSMQGVIIALTDGNNIFGITEQEMVTVHEN